MARKIVETSHFDTDGRSSIPHTVGNGIMKQDLNKLYILLHHCKALVTLITNIAVVYTSSL